jgi:hypothetical protein
MATAEHKPQYRFRAVAPDGDMREAATDAAVRRTAGLMFQRHFRSITLQRLQLRTPNAEWEDYDQISTGDWWKSTGRRDIPVEEEEDAR